MGKILKLNEQLINLIAAGEVVERPASVLKELVENSLDAHADKITIKLVEGGKQLIEVTDNGVGMEADDAQLAFAQHATSKVATAADLNNIATYGFRGEALASISAVSEVALDTTASGQSTQVLVLQGVSRVSAGNRMQQGTQIAIRDLFANVPARQKFLRSTATELQQCTDTFIAATLTNLQVHWEFYHNDKLMHRLPPAATVQERIYALWGSVAEQLYHYEQVGDFKLDIYLGTPEVARKDRKLQYIFVNHRHINDRLIQKAVSESYRGFIHRDLQPVYFVFMELSPQEVDVNVHPRKQEVKFANSQAVYGAVYRGARNLLEQATKQSLSNRIEEVRGVEQLSVREDSSSAATSASPFGLTEPTSSWKVAAPLAKPKIQQGLDFTRNLLRDSGAATQSSPAATTASSSLQREIYAGTNLWQAFATYIVYQQDDNIVFVDQHAAAEKILYEKIRRQSNLNQSQPLLVPEILELDTELKHHALAHLQQFAALGLHIADFGGNAIQVTAKPSATPHLDVANFIAKTIDSLEESGEVQFSDFNNAEDLEAHDPRLHYMIATMACHGSIRAGQVLSPVEMQQIIHDLGQCRFPYNCPHGRPVSWVLSKQELEKNFKRII